MIVKAHTSIIGDTGYNCHARNFFKELDKITPVQVRNWTVGKTWDGYNNDQPHNNEYYMDDQLKKMLVEQTLTSPNGNGEFPLYQKYGNNRTPDIHIVLNDNTHCYFDQTYGGKTIAYNVWETTRQPHQFFEKLKRFDQVWVPTEWQRRCTIEQGISADKVKVVPEGVDIKTYKPKNRVISRPVNKPFRFVLVGRWEYRKATREIIQTFVNTFSEDENVELILNVENPFATDGLKSTEERLKKFGISHKRIKVVDHLSKEEYVDLIQSADVFLSCARGEGWNLPLIEAMSCGIPSFYSNWGAQLQFAEGRGIPVNVKGEVSAGVQNDESWDSNAPGNFAEPDFNDLSQKMKDVVKKYPVYKKKALDDSDEIRELFTWENAAKIAKQFIDELIMKPKQKISIGEKPFKDDFAYITCGNINYMPLIEKMVQSLMYSSDQKVIVYGIDCDVPFNYPNLISRRLDPPKHSEHDKWYWKQYACIESLNEEFQNYVWIDGDVVANNNIDGLSNHFNRITNYPIPDVHFQEEFFAMYVDKFGEMKSQIFNEILSVKNGVAKKWPIAHVCLYVYNQQCKWWFEEIIKLYKETPLEYYEMLLQWNDEGIDNLLRQIHQCHEYLPLSNLDLSGWGNSEQEIYETQKKCFMSYWNESGKKNFGRIYGWSYIPTDKSKVLYFHGNKNIEFAEFMIQYIKMKKEDSFYDSQWFYVGKNEVKNLGEILGVEGSTLDIANKYGWDYAIYHEIYNLKDYERYGGMGINKGDIVVDLGGNIGIFTRYAYQCGAEKIITFEPDRRYFQLLKKNSPSNVILFNAAIGDGIGKMKLTESEHLGGSNLWSPSNPMHTQYDVQIYSLDYLFYTGLVEKIDFLKVDIEGSEIIAFDGISDENLSNVNNIAIEYHHEHLKFDTNLRDRFISRLNRLGFNSHILFCGDNDALQLIYFWR